MGYTLSIGEAKEIIEDDGYKYVTTEGVTNRNSPGGNVPTAYTNSRWPSYSGWADFCRDTGLVALMNDLMPDHPGYAVLHEMHLDKMKQVDRSKIEPYNVERLEWLIWWTEWALKNCKKPIFYNS